jgi:hypothetical protein
MDKAKEDSIRILIQEMEVEQVAMKKYMARAELMASTLRSVIEMYRLTGTKESRTADFEHKFNQSVEESGREL